MLESTSSQWKEKFFIANRENIFHKTLIASVTVIIQQIFEQFAYRSQYVDASPADCFFFCVAGLCVLRSIQTRWQYSPNGAYNIQTYAVNYRIEMCMRCQIFVLLVCFAANFRLIRCESGDVKQQKNIVWITIVSSEGRTIEQAFSS